MRKISYGDLLVDLLPTATGRTDRLPVKGWVTKLRTLADRYEAQEIKERTCETCGREFGTVQGLGLHHTRGCKA